MPRVAALIAAFLLTACAAPPPAGPVSAPTAPAGPAPASAPAPVPAPAQESRRLPPAAPVTSVDLDNAADGTPVTIKRGAALKVILDANLTTGFQWQEVPPSTAPVLAPVGQREYVNRSAQIQNLGSGGMNIFRFRGEQPGKVTLQFEYRRPWETVPPVKTVRYEVTVE